MPMQTETRPFLHSNDDRDDLHPAMSCTAKAGRLSSQWPCRTGRLASAQHPWLPGKTAKAMNRAASCEWTAKPASDSAADGCLRFCSLWRASGIALPAHSKAVPSCQKQPGAAQDQIGLPCADDATAEADRQLRGSTRAAPLKQHSGRTIWRYPHACGRLRPAKDRGWA